jgi:thermitase
MNNKILFVIILLFAVLFIPQSAYSLYTGKTEQASQEFSSTRLIVKLKPEADKKVSWGKVSGKVTTGLAELDRLNLKFSVTDQKQLFGEFKQTTLKSEDLSSIYLLEVPEGTNLKEMKKEYEQRPEVEYAELDYKLELFERRPNDPFFVHQWYLNNAGQGYLGVNRIPGDFNDTQVIKFGTVDADIDALEAFQRNDPTVPILVGIIDTGVDLDHEDLAENIWVNPGEDLDGDGIISPSDKNGIDDDHNGFVDDFYGWDFAGNDLDEIVEDNDPTDTYGHGTHCAGIVAGVRNNALGVSGINTPCKIMAIKSFPDYSGGTFISLCAEGIIYAADMGCNVINMSFGGSSPSKILEDALDYAVSKGVLPIAAAGNCNEATQNCSRQDEYYPAAYPQVFTVGASNSKDEVTYFSVYGDPSDSHYIEVVAPGEDILSLRADSTDMYRGGCSGGTCPGPTEHIIPYPDGHYYLADGTSMASPCAVGVAAYIMSASPGISNDRVVEIMEQSADDITYPYGDSTLPPLYGKDIYSGYGRVNLNSALGLLLSGRIAEIDYPYQNALVSGEVAIIGTASGDSFQSYTLEYGQGVSPQAWTEITSSTIPVTKDTLGIWNSSGLTGLFTLRLTVGDQNQATVHVIANSGTCVEITSPSEGDTVMGVAEIRGYTIAPDFSSYILEYKREEPSSSWITITSSTKMVADGGILGEWVVSNLKRDNYTLRLTVETNSGETYVDSLVVYVKSIVSNSWSQGLSACGSLSPAIGDIDGDGSDEIVVGVGGSEGGTLAGGIEVFTHNGEREYGWPRDTDLNMMSSPALGDLDKDGINDIVICSKQQGVHTYLSSSPSWVRNIYTGGNDFWALATPVIADLENDSYPEVLTIDNQGTVYAWRNNGESVIPGNNGFFAQATTSDAGMGFPCLAVADLDGDGENEVIAGSATATSGVFGHYIGEGGVYIWDINGNLPLSSPWFMALP